MTYTFTDNPTEPTDSINPDVLNSCLMWLKKDYCPRNHIDGLITSNNGTDAAHDIDISAGECADSTNATKIKSGSTLTKRIDANWSAGNAGGFPSGLTLAADTTYHVFVIMKPDYTVDAGFDTSLTASNLLADATGYTYYRRIGSIITDGSSNIISFKQIGDKFILKDIVQDVNTSPTTSAVSHTLTVPNGIAVIADMNIYCAKTADGFNYGLIYSPSQTDLTPSSSLHNAFCAVDNGQEWRNDSYCNYLIITNTVKQIKSIFTAADGTIKIFANGWIDLRGKE